MKKYIFTFLLTLIFVVNTDGSPQKRDLVDEVLEKLAALRGNVEAGISEGQNNIDDLVISSQTNLKNLNSQTEVSLDQKWTNVWFDVLKLKELSVGYNINVCLQWREDVILRLPQRCRDDLNTCLDPWNKNLVIINTDSKNNIGAALDEVDDLDSQVKECNGNLLCLSPLVTLIETASTQVSQKIGVEVNQAEALIKDVDVNVADCMDQAVAYMVEIGPMCVRDIGTCVDNIMTCGSYFC